MSHTCLYWLTLYCNISWFNFAGDPIVMFINIYGGDLPKGKTCNFDKPLNKILPCKHQITDD